MNERTEDQIDLEEARAAVQTARIDAVKVDVVVAAVQKSSSDIRTLVEANGYVSRFRQVLRGAN